jgi:phage shock protein PspC (stress-responsive transcriptional regulator)
MSTDELYTCLEVWLSRSEISIGDCFVSTILVRGRKFFVLYEAFPTLVTGVCLGLTVTLGVDLTVLPFALCTTTFGVGAMTGSVVGMVSVG